MKTLGEVIKALESARIQVKTGYGLWVDYRDNDDLKADALHYLKEYRKLDSLDAVALAEDDNPPLTWEELQGMEGKPVWVECGAKRWIVIADFREDVNGAEYFEATDGGLFSAKTQGDLWQAYRTERKCQ